MDVADNDIASLTAEPISKNQKKKKARDESPLNGYNKQSELLKKLLKTPRYQFLLKEQDERRERRQGKIVRDSPL